MSHSGSDLPRPKQIYRRRKQQHHVPSQPTNQPTKDEARQCKQIHQPTNKATRTMCWRQARTEKKSPHFRKHTNWKLSKVTTTTATTTTPTVYDPPFLFSLSPRAPQEEEQEQHQHQPLPALTSNHDATAVDPHHTARLARPDERDGLSSRR